MTSQRGHVAFLDAIRGCAALAVFLFHIRHAIEQYLPANEGREFVALFKDGWIGVAIFFALSGFCIHLSHIRSSSNSWTTYFSRRLKRIAPSYLLALLVFVSLSAMFDGIQTISLPDQLTHLLGIHNLFPAYVYSYNGSFWSIAVEMQLYALYPLIFLMMRRFGWLATLVIVGCIEGLLRSSIAFDLVPSARHAYASVSMLPFYFWFSWTIGAYAADNYHYGRQSVLAKVPTSITAVIAVVALNIPAIHPLKFPIISILTASSLERWTSYPLLSPNIAGKVGHHLSTLGMVSYSFYLYHQPFMNFLF